MRREMMVSMVAAAVLGGLVATGMGQVAHAQEQPLPVVCEPLPAQRGNMQERFQRLRDRGYREFVLVGNSDTGGVRGTVCAW